MVAPKEKAGLEASAAAGAEVEASVVAGAGVVAPNETDGLEAASAAAGTEGSVGFSFLRGGG